MTMLKHKPRAPGNYDPNEASAAASILCPEPTRTQQHTRDETDINLIVKRYQSTGILPQSALAPLYGDFETVDFHDAQNRLIAARQAFLRIPAEIRSRFDNDPGKFVEFASNPENHDELVRLKLRDPPPSNKPPYEPPLSNGGAKGLTDPPPQG